MRSCVIPPTLAVGETVKLSGMTAEVRSVVPRVAPHRCSLPSTNPSKTLTPVGQIQRRPVCSWTPPGVGESIELIRPRVIRREGRTR